MPSSDPPIRTPTTPETVAPPDVPATRAADGSYSTDAAVAYERGRADALAADAAAARERERTLGAVRERDRTLEQERRAEPRRRGGGMGLLGLLVLLLAIVGGIFLFLSWRQGSLAGGGAAMSNQVSSVTQPAKDAVADARNATGAAVENAGEALKNSGQRIKQP